MNFRGAQDENHPLGGLFQRLQQRVESVRGDLMRLIDDEHLISIARRTIADVVPQLAHFIDPAIRGRVDFDGVRSVAQRDFDAAGTYAAGRGRGPLQAVQAAGQDARHGGLASAALPREDVSVGDPPLGDGVLKSGPDVLLANEVRKALGPVLAGEYLINRSWRGSHGG